MSKETSKTMIGGFVVGALALGVAAVLVFGSGGVFKKTNKWVLFFDGSVKGLDVGAPVLFRGVQVGSVTDIKLTSDLETMTAQIPVYIETDPSRWEIKRSEEMAPVAKMTSLIEKGLRAQLELKSLVTGKLMIEVDFHPDEPVRLVGADPTCPEVPTIQTSFQKITRKLEGLPLEESFQKLSSAIAGIEEIVNSPATREFVPTLNSTVDGLRTLIQDLGPRVGSISASCKRLADDADQQLVTLATDIRGAVRDYGTLARNLDARVEPLVSDAGKAINDYGKLARNADDRIGPLVEDVRETAHAITAAAEKAESTLESVRSVISGHSPVTAEMTATLRELSAAARSIRVWADYLERHPEALIRGKGGYRR